MILGVDIVPIERLRTVLARSAGMEARLFTARERAYCDGHPDRVRHLAGTLAAKEAVIKACRLGALAAFARRIEVSRDPDGAPTATVIGFPQHRTTLSISHDGGVAVAVAMSDPIEEQPEPEGLRPNPQLESYIKGASASAATMVSRALVNAEHLTHGTDFP